MLVEKHYGQFSSPKISVHQDGLLAARHTPTEKGLCWPWDHSLTILCAGKKKTQKQKQKPHTDAYFLVKDL